MKLTFTYDRQHDIGCILTFGKTSRNMPYPTKVYEELTTRYGEDPSSDNTDAFIEIYTHTNNIDIDAYQQKYQKEWDMVASEYQTRAEKTFKTKLSYDVSAYLTINDRCPYSVEERMFFVSTSAYSSTKTAMHELWHFYTWQRFGKEWEDRLGKQKYNDIKESLTVLLNVECKDILPKNVIDRGYDHHQELRQKILTFWEQEKDIDKLWEYCVQQ